MPVTYELANETIKHQVGTIIDLYHKDLVIAGVRICVMLAYGPVNADGVKTGPALQVNGYTALGTAQILNLRNRVLSGYDALITFDGDQWESWPEKAQHALIDHELHHLEVNWEEAPDIDAGDMNGVPKRDDAGRPKLLMRRHDWQFGGFQAIAERWGKFSFERAHARQIVDNFGQYLFDFAPESDNPAVAGTVAKSEEEAA